MPNNFTIVIVVNDEQPVNKYGLFPRDILRFIVGVGLFLLDNYLSEVVTVKCQSFLLYVCRNANIHR